MRAHTLASAALLVALGVGGVATAAVSSPQDRPAKKPAATGHATTKPTTPVGPDATGHAAHGLCQAFAGKDKTDATDSVAYRNLAAAAGGADKIAAYCASVPHPGGTKTKPPRANGEPKATKAAKPERTAPGRPDNPGANGRGHAKRNGG